MVLARGSRAFSPWKCMVALPVSPAPWAGLQDCGPLALLMIVVSDEVSGGKL